MKLRRFRSQSWTHLVPVSVLLLATPTPSAHAQAEITPPPPAEAPPSNPAPTQGSELQVSAIDGGGWAVLSSTTGQLIDLNPGPAWNTLVQSAKAAEEGDADLTTASDQYVAIVRIFDQLRPIAAEALYRYALVENKRSNSIESQSAHFRLIQWFPDFSDYVRKSLAARNEAAAPAEPGKTSTLSGNRPPSFQMSPAWLVRYGLGPAPGPDPNASAAGGTDAKMQRRYGLGGGPATDANPASSDPTRYSMSPELMRRYGLLESPATLPESNPVSPAESAATGAKRVLLDQQRTEILTELSRTQSDLGKAQRELSRFESMPPVKIPPNLVSDPRLRQLIEDATEPATPNLNEQQALARINALEVYFQTVYIPRLQRTQEILMRESDILRVRLNNLIQETKDLAKEP